MSKILAIDGNSIINRSFYGIKSLSTKSGQPTNAIYGFLTKLINLKNQHKPSSIIVAFDLPTKTFRHDLFSDYKGTRKGTPDELKSQFPIIKEILKYLGIYIIEKEGFEADDILGTIASFSQLNKIPCIISSGDRDSLQLVTPYVNVLLATNKENIIFDIDKINETYSISPTQLIEVKALMGDASDNIPGVKGIGEKTALSLIQSYQNIQNIYNILETDSENTIKPRVKKLLIEEKETAFLSKELGTIICDVPLELDIDKIEIKQMDDEKIYSILTKLEMPSIISSLNLSSYSSVNLKEPKIIIDPSVSDIIKLIDNQDDKYLDFIISFDISQEFINLIKINISNSFIIFTKNFIEIIQQILLNKNFIKRTFDSKSIYKFFNKNNYQDIQIDYDLLLASHLIDPSAKTYDIESLVDIYIDELEFKIPDDDKYITKEILYLTKLIEITHQKIKDYKMEYLLLNIEQPLSLVIANMENIGFSISNKELYSFGEKLKIKISEIEKILFEIAGEEFNPLSTKHVATIIYEKLQLPTGKRTKTGYSTDAKALEFLIGKHPIIEYLLEYRQLSKLNSTYVDGFLKLLDKNNRVHSIFKQTETRTGRLSSTQPNLQNIPIRTEIGKNMRKFFIAKDGYMLIGADYSQIELRILADISQDPNMIDAFTKKQDIHISTASKIFNIPIDAVSSSQRSYAKSINFGILYGMGAFSLAKEIDSSVEQAKEYIEDYLENFKKIKIYMEKTIQNAKINGFVSTKFNRIRHIPELLSSNKNIISLGERLAMNTPIQGFAADIIKIAMIDVFNKLKSENIDGNLILQVHDELILEILEKDVKRALPILSSCMENAVSLSIPLAVDINYGKSWYDAK